MGGKETLITVKVIETEEDHQLWIEAVTLALTHPTACKILNDDNLDIITIHDPDNDIRNNNN